MNIKKSYLSLFIATLAVLTVAAGCNNRTEVSDINTNEKIDDTTDSKNAQIYYEVINECISKYDKKRFKEMREYLDNIKNNDSLSSEYVNDDLDSLALLYLYIEDTYNVDKEDLVLIKNTFSNRVRNDAIIRYKENEAFEASLEVNFDNKVINYKDNFIEASYTKVIDDFIKMKLSKVFNGDIPFLAEVSSIKTSIDVIDLDIDTLGKTLEDTQDEFEVLVSIYIDSRNEWYANVSNYSQKIIDSTQIKGAKISFWVYIVDTPLDNYTTIDELSEASYHIKDTQRIS